MGQVWAQRATAVHLFNPVFLSQVTDQYLRHAILNGRPPTAMEAWAGKLTDEQVGDVIAFLCSLAQPAAVPPPPQLPPTEEWTASPVINPKGEQVDFTLKDDRLVSPEALHQALKDKRRVVILDARAPSDFTRLHIPGAMSMPYYDLRNIDKVPNDGTWVIAYCACPHHASGEVVDALRKRGYKHTAVMNEGIFAYQHKDFEVIQAPDAVPTPAPPPDVHPPGGIHGAPIPSTGVAPIAPGSIAPATGVAVPPRQ